MVAEYLSLLYHWALPKVRTEAALQYAKERHQFDKPIASFQGICFKLADMATEIEAADLLTQKACHLKMTGENVTQQAAMAKYYASEVAVKVAT